MVRSPTLMVLVLAPLAFVEIEGSAVAVTRGAVCNELGRLVFVNVTTVRRMS